MAEICTAKEAVVRIQNGIKCRLATLCVGGGQGVATIVERV